MDRRLIALIISALIFLTFEGYLIFIDRARKKGTTTIDRRTRFINIISIGGVITLAPIMCWLDIFQFTNVKISGFFWIGILVMCLGFFLRHWSIHVLGNAFRTTVEIEKGQDVVQNGPYRLIRHPSYSGILLFIIGYGLVTQNWIILLIVLLLPTCALLYRIEIEEKALIKGMGSSYEVYRKKTKKLIPVIW